MKSLPEKKVIIIHYRPMGLPNMESTSQHMRYVATSETIYHLGLRKIFSGSAQNTLDTLTEIFDDLNVVNKKLGGSNV